MASGQSQAADGALEKAADKAASDPKKAWTLHLIRQTIDALWLPGSLSKEQQAERIATAIIMLNGFKPADELEGMLSAQMVATHTAAMECLRRAMIEEQTFAGRDQNLKHASKLLSIYARQLDALNKHRGKGQQKVTVEHVHVEAGGQAVVGHVETGQRQAQSPPKGQKAIPHALAETLDLKPHAKVAVERREKGRSS
jgi:D-tyrosyl-tRNA(Tyr) deacylase